MTPTKDLLKLYGPAALTAPVRILHERVIQLELEIGLLTAKHESDIEKLETQLKEKDVKYYELQERVFRKEQVPSTFVDSEPIKVKKHKASRVRDKIAAAMREEDRYYAALADAKNNDTPSQ